MASDGCLICIGWPKIGDLTAIRGPKAEDRFEQFASTGADKSSKTEGFAFPHGERNVFEFASPRQRFDLKGLVTLGV